MEGAFLSARLIKENSRFGRVRRSAGEECRLTPARRDLVSVRPVEDNWFQFYAAALVLYGYPPFEERG